MVAAGMIMLLGVAPIASLPAHADTWAYRFSVEVDGTTLTQDMNGFPLYIDMSQFPAEFFEFANDDAGDLRVVTDDNATTLPIEIVGFDREAQSGELYVKLPHLSAGTTTHLYAYFGNAQAQVSQEAAKAVWSDYEAVWHMNTPDSNAPQLEFGVVSAAGIDGGDGYWPMLYGADPVADNTISVVAAEDDLGDSDKKHTSEEVAYFAFGADESFVITDEDDAAIGETSVVHAVGSDFMAISLERTYTNPVIVATPIATHVDDETVTRIAAVDGDSFQLKRQSPGDTRAVTPGAVHYVVIEAGEHTLPGGRVVTAGTLDAATTARKGTYSNATTYQVNTSSFSDPIVVGQVMSTNDARWSVFTAFGTSAGNPPSTAMTRIGKQVLEDPSSIRLPETLGYVVVDAGSGTFSTGQTWHAGRTSDTIQGLQDSPPYHYVVPTAAGGVRDAVYYDATGNGYDLGVRGEVSNTQEFLGSSLQVGATGYLPIAGKSYQTRDFTDLYVSSWINTRDTSGSILDFDRSEYWSFSVNFQGCQNGQLALSTVSRDQCGPHVADGTWRYVGGMIDTAQTQEKALFVDGVRVSSVDHHSGSIGTNGLRYGFVGEGSEANAYDGSRNNKTLQGGYDELRFRESAVSDEWVRYEYVNFTDPQSVVAIGPFENLVPIEPAPDEEAVPPTTRELTAQPADTTSTTSPTFATPFTFFSNASSNSSSQQASVVGTPLDPTQATLAAQSSAQTVASQDAGVAVAIAIIAIIVVLGFVAVLFL